MMNEYPVAEIEKNVYEIDEFDCASIFVIVGSERALVLDTGTGIGMLREQVERLIGEKPYDVLISHGHFDHTGGVHWFDQIYENPKDWEEYAFPPRLEDRRNYAKAIRSRSGKNYPYEDMDIAAAANCPVRKPLTDGMRFFLGDRTVTAYDCPGHTRGEMVFIDDASKILFAGDAINGMLLYDVANVIGNGEFVSVEDAYHALKRLETRGGYQSIYNFHHDYRPFGKPLGEDIFPNILKACERLLEGRYEVVHLPGMFEGFPPRTAVIEGNVTVCFKKEHIYTKRKGE